MRRNKENQEKGKVNIMEKEKIAEKVLLLNKKIKNKSKELQELKLEEKRRQLEIRKYKNKLEQYNIKLQEIEYENNEKNKEEKFKRKLLKKYDDLNNEYYSHEKKFMKDDFSYADYFRNNIVPYND